MFGRLVALLTAPLWLAVTKTKPARVKRPAKKATRPARGKPKPAPARPPAASKKSAPLRPQPKPAEELVEAPPPPVAPVQAPGLILPAPGVSTESLTPVFRWFYVGGARLYELQWSSEPNFHKAHILLTDQTAATLPPEQALEPEKTYLWRVRAGNESGLGPWSPTRSFRTPEK